MTGVDPTLEFIQRRENGDIGAVNPGVAFFNDNYESAILDVPIYAHSIEQNPNDSSKIMLIPRRGSKCVEYDIIMNKVSATLDLGKKSFYGHGCYVPGTNLFYAAAFYQNTYQTSIVVFNYKENKLLNEITVEGSAGAHQCSLSRDKNYVIMTFSEPTEKHKPSLVWISVKTGEVVKRVYGMRNNAEHFASLEDNYIIFTGGVQSKEVETVIGSIDSKDQVLNFKNKTENFEKFSGLSVSILGFESKSISLVTNLVENSVYIHNYKSGELISRIETPSPRGISLSNDLKKLFITTLPGPNQHKAPVKVYDLETLKEIHEFEIKNALAYGSHTSKFIF